jgi:hypothetical protein
VQCTSIVLHAHACVQYTVDWVQYAEELAYSARACSSEARSCARCATACTFVPMLLERRHSVSSGCIMRERSTVSLASAGTSPMRFSQPPRAARQQQLRASTNAAGTTTQPPHDARAPHILSFVDRRGLRWLNVNEVEPPDFARENSRRENAPQGGDGCETRIRYR